MSHPPLVSIKLGGNTALENLFFTSGNDRHSYHLRGLIYYSENHFTAWFFAQSGMVWYHNGLFTGQSLVSEGMMPIEIPHEMLRNTLRVHV
ncbi:hypothetical protein L208DRAFT_1287238 [Tricholoma matsutake]|nr:hypothetical protein L208DRAFT_1287238 [Tricholoma matsutake 945]